MCSGDKIKHIIFHRCIFHSPQISVYKNIIQGSYLLLWRCTLMSFVPRHVLVSTGICLSVCVCPFVNSIEGGGHSTSVFILAFTFLSRTLIILSFLYKLHHSIFHLYSCSYISFLHTLIRFVSSHSSFIYLNFLSLHFCFAYFNPLFLFSSFSLSYSTIVFFIYIPVPASNFCLL